MHIAEMTVGPSSHPAFQQNITFSFDERVNVFVGPNASGKTSLLRVLASVRNAEQSAIYPYDPVEMRLSKDWASSFENQSNYPLADLALEVDNRSALNSLENGSEYLWAVPCVYVPATRVTLPNEFDWDNLTLSDDGDDGLSFQSDAHIFDGRAVAKRYKMLHDDLKNKDYQKFGALLRVARIAHHCAARISKEILIGQGSNYVSNIENILHSQEDYYDPLAVEPSIHPGMGALTRPSLSGRPVEQYIGDLSAGTQEALLWVLYLGLRMMSHYEDEHLHKEWGYAFQRYGRRWDQRPAILLIDEIENHLHPTWQRRVIPALLEHFPGLQIFATTHSPFVVAGLKAGQVHLLNRDANGVVTASTNTEDIVGWTADEILRTMMGVDDPTDDETARNAAELRQLRDEGPRATPEEEEQRQAEMQRLRRLVNRDLLAGGPAAAQRELFEQQFAEALEKYQQSHDLSQENG